MVSNWPQKKLKYWTKNARGLRRRTSKRQYPSREHLLRVAKVPRLNLILRLRPKLLKYNSNRLQMMTLSIESCLSLKITWILASSSILIILSRIGWSKSNALTPKNLEERGATQKRGESECLSKNNERNKNYNMSKMYRASSHFRNPKSNSNRRCSAWSTREELHTSKSLLRT